MLCNCHFFSTFALVGVSLAKRYIPNPPEKVWSGDVMESVYSNI